MKTKVQIKAELQRRKILLKKYLALHNKFKGYYEGAWCDALEWVLDKDKE